MTDAAQPEATQPRANPFPGLRAFEADDAHLFFGREGQSEDILRALHRSRLLAVVGASGSGKSSLVRAALLPYLYGGFLEEAGSHWRIVLFRPGDDPIVTLSRALIDQSVLEAKPADPAEMQRRTLLMTAQLRRSGLGLVEAVRLARLPPSDNVLIVVDQFEELFRFGSAAGPAASEEAAAFVKLLLEASRQSNLPIYVCLTMRSDFIGDCARFRDLPEAVTAGLYLIPRLTRPQRRAAIEEPVRVGGGSIAPRLVTRILNDVGDDPDQLPIMQHALMRAWDHWQSGGTPKRPIDLQDYEAIGGLVGALSMHADEAFNSLDERGKMIARKLFQRLTEKDADNREARRPSRLSAVAEIADGPVEEIAGVVEVFRAPGRSFLMPPRPTPLEPNTVIDISHESLIRGWKRLREWVEEETESARVYKRLADTAALHAAGRAGLWRDPDLAVALAWLDRESPTEAWSRRYHGGWRAAMAFLADSRRARDADGRAARLRQRLTAGAAIVFLVVAGAAVFAERQAQQAASQAAIQRDRAEQQTKLAQAQTVIAETAKQQALDSATEAAKQRDRAEEQTQIALKNEAEAKHQADIAENAFKFSMADVLNFAALYELWGSLDNNLHGEYDTALSELKDWDDIIGEYIKDRPNDSYWLQQIAHFKSTTADVLVLKSDYQGAIAQYNESSNILQQIVAKEPANASCRADILMTQKSISDTLIKLNRKPEALATLLAAKTHETGLPIDDTHLPALRYAFAMVEIKLGDELLAAARAEEARTSFMDARGLLTDLVAQDTKNTSWLQALAASDLRVGDAFQRNQQLAEAMGVFADASKAYAAAASLKSDDVDFTIGGIGALTKLGSAQLALKRPDQALITFNDALARIAAASGSWPNNSYFPKSYVFAQSKIGEILASQNKPADAVKAFQLARDREKEIITAAPSDLQLKTELAKIDGSLSDLLVKLDRPDDALGILNEDINAARADLTVAPNNIDRQDDLVIGYVKVAHILIARKQYDDAAADYRQALELRRTLLKSQPNNMIARRAEIDLLRELGNTLAQGGKDDAALASYRDGVDAGAKLVALNAADADSLRAAAVVNADIGLFLFRKKNFDGAATSSRDALDLWERFAAQRPEDSAGQAQIDRIYGLIGHIDLAQDKLFESSAAFEKCLSMGKATTGNDTAAAASWPWLYDCALQLGNLSYQLDLAKQFQKALDDAELALAATPDNIFIEANRAHALMFLGRTQEARDIYLRYRGTQINGKSWEQATLDDFAELRKAGLTDPLMDEIQKAFAA